jgi:hypothetical protein
VLTSVVKIYTGIEIIHFSIYVFLLVRACVCAGLALLFIILRRKINKAEIDHIL